MPSLFKKVPLDPDRLNDKRSEWANAALVLFQATTSTDDEDALCDLLCDLMHWADRNNMTFVDELRRAEGHYEAETGGEPC